MSRAALQVSVFSATHKQNWHCLLKCCLEAAAAEFKESRPKGRHLDQNAERTESDCERCWDHALAAKGPLRRGSPPEHGLISEAPLLLCLDLSRKERPSSKVEFALQEH